MYRGCREGKLCVNRLAGQRMAAMVTACLCVSILYYINIYSSGTARRRPNAILQLYIRWVTINASNTSTHIRT